MLRSLTLLAGLGLMGMVLGCGHCVQHGVCDCDAPPPAQGWGAQHAPGYMHSPGSHPQVVPQVTPQAMGSAEEIPAPTKDAEASLPDKADEADDGSDTEKTTPIGF
jgi:hypothetical protein